MLAPAELSPAVVARVEAVGLAAHATARASVAGLVAALLVGQSARCAERALRPWLLATLHDGAARLAAPRGRLTTSEHLSCPLLWGRG